VGIKKEDGRVSFSIEDDGKGFDLRRVVSASAAGKGFGLSIMDERVRMLGGVLDLQSEDEKGTRTTFVIPLKKKGTL
jgi:two-component system sensor histidine kinase DegS